MALVAKVDADMHRAIDIATGLASTVLAVHACDPAQPAETAEFTRTWDALGLEIALVLVAAEPHLVGAEILAYITRQFSSRQVHVVINAVPPSDQHTSSDAVLEGPSAQLGRSLHQVPNVVVHWIMRADQRGRKKRQPKPSPNKTPAGEHTGPTTGPDTSAT